MVCIRIESRERQFEPWASSFCQNLEVQEFEEQMLDIWLLHAVQHWVHQGFDPLNKNRTLLCFMYHFCRTSAWACLQRWVLYCVSDFQVLRIRDAQNRESANTRDLGARENICAARVHQSRPARSILYMIFFPTTYIFALGSWKASGVAQVVLPLRFHGLRLIHVNAQKSKVVIPWLLCNFWDFITFWQLALLKVCNPNFFFSFVFSRLPQFGRSSCIYNFPLFYNYATHLAHALCFDWEWSSDE